MGSGGRGGGRRGGRGKELNFPADCGLLGVTSLPARTSPRRSVTGLARPNQSTVS